MWSDPSSTVRAKFEANFDSLAKTRYDLSQREIGISRCGLRARVSIEPGLTQ